MNQMLNNNLSLYVADFNMYPIRIFLIVQTSPNNNDRCTAEVLAVFLMLTYLSSSNATNNYKYICATIF